METNVEKKNIEYEVIYETKFGGRKTKVVEANSPIEMYTIISKENDFLRIKEYHI